MAESESSAPKPRVATWGPLGIVIAPSATFEEWEAIFLQASGAQRSINWWLGDVLRIGEERYGEKFSQVLDAKYKEQHAEKMWVASKIPFERRRETLSWSLHREVAALDETDQVRWLDKAEEGQWTVKALKESIAAEKAARKHNNPPPDEGEQLAQAEPGAVEPDEDGEAPAAEGAEQQMAPSDILEPATTEQRPFGSADAARLADKVGAEFAANRSTSIAPTTESTSAVRQLINDLRAFNEKAGAQTEDETIDLEQRLVEHFEPTDYVEPLRNTDDAISLRRDGWLISIDEDENGAWKSTLRKDGKQRAFGISMQRPVAVVEALLAAEISEVA